MIVSGRVEPDSLLSKLCAYLSGEREALLNSSTHLDTIYEKVVLRGDTLPPPAQYDVDPHYMCFIKSPNCSIDEMDGDASGPVKTDTTLKQDEDMLEVSALQRVKRCIAREDADGKFSLLALLQDSSITNAPVSVLIAHTAVVDIKYTFASHQNFI